MASSAAHEQQEGQAAHCAELEDENVAVTRKIQVVDMLRETYFGASHPSSPDRYAAVGSLCKVARTRPWPLGRAAPLRHRPATAPIACPPRTATAARR